MEELKNVKLRELVRKLNNQRRSQKKQIDILCNDILGAHGEFINHLKNFRFAADFYENLLEANCLESIAKATGEFLTENIDNTNAAIVFTTSGRPEVHFYSQDPTLEDVPTSISPFITTKFVEAVCHSNKICDSDALCEMEFFAGPAVLKRISLAAVGLNRTGPSLGMIMLYRPADKPLTHEELIKVSTVVKGLSKAVKTAHGSSTIDSFA